MRLRLRGSLCCVGSRSSRGTGFTRFFRVDISEPRAATRVAQLVFRSRCVLRQSPARLTRAPARTKHHPGKPSPPLRSHKIQPTRIQSIPPSHSDCSPSSLSHTATRALLTPARKHFSLPHYQPPNKTSRCTQRRDTGSMPRQSAPGQPTVHNRR
jgi:hypothetical protein